MIGLWDRPPTLQARYAAWRDTPNGRAVIEAVTEAALNLRHRGWKSYGMKALFEGARYTYALRMGPDAEGYKLNNSYTSRLARDLMAEYSELGAFFELRALRS